MRPTSEALLGRWHRMLGLLRQSPPWYRGRLLEELQGRQTANTPWQKLVMTAYRAAGLVNRKGANCVVRLGDMQLFLV